MAVNFNVMVEIWQIIGSHFVYLVIFLFSACLWLSKTNKEKEKKYSEMKHWVETNNLLRSEYIQKQQQKKIHSEKKEILNTDLLKSLAALLWVENKDNASVFFVF